MSNTIEDSWDNVAKMRHAAERYALPDGKPHPGWSSIAQRMSDRLLARHAEPVAVPDDPCALRPYQIEAMRYSRGKRTIVVDVGLGKAGRASLQLLDYQPLKPST